MSLSNRTLSKRPMSEADIKVSFEFFPPNTPAMEKRLWDSVEKLAPLGPSFVSVTYGAGGSTRERTHATISKLMAENNVSVAAHLTCVGATREEVNEVVREYHAAGVRHFVALRGDAPEGVGHEFNARGDGYQNGAELVAGLKAFADFEISVSAYPEKHPDSPDFATDIDMLKRKVDNGATRAITQFFFDNDLFESYVERVRKAGIYIPIVPGIAPVTNFKSISTFAGKCGTHIPQWVADRFDGLENDPQTSAYVAAALAAEQVMDLVERGVVDYHFYTMNRAELVYAICHQLGLRPSDNDENGETIAA